MHTLENVSLLPEHYVTNFTGVFENQCFGAPDLTRDVMDQ